MRHIRALSLTSSQVDLCDKLARGPAKPKRALAVIDWEFAASLADPVRKTTTKPKRAVAAARPPSAQPSAFVASLPAASRTVGASVVMKIMAKSS